MVKIRRLSTIYRQIITYKYAPTRDKEIIEELIKEATMSNKLLGLTMDESSALMDVSKATYSRLKAGKYPQHVGQDTQMRADILKEIKGLVLKDGRLKDWLFTPYALGKDLPEIPITAMITGGIPAMKHVLKEMEQRHSRRSLGRPRPDDN